MNKCIFAAAVFVPAIALAVPVTTTTTTTSAAPAAKSQKADSSAKNKDKDKGKSNNNADTNGGGANGTARASDVTLGGIAASQLIYSGGVNPQQGPNGNASGFAGAWSGSDWLSFSKFSGAATGTGSATLGGLALSTGFALNDTRHGVWSITNTSTANDLMLDLVFAMHTGGGSGSWLFDNFNVAAGATVSGSWSLNLLNNGGQLADYSNLTLFARDAAATAVRIVEPVVTAPVVPPVVPPAPVVIPAPSAPVLTEVVVPPVVVPAPVEIPAPATPVVTDVVLQPVVSELLEEINEHRNDQPANEVPAAELPVDDAGSAGSSEVPEPGMLGMFATALALFGVARRRRAAAPANAAI